MTHVTSTIIDAPEELTSGWFTDALRGGGFLSEAEAVTDAEVRRFGTGQFGLVVRATLTYDGPAPDAPRSVMVKLPSPDPRVRQFALATGSYEAEVRFYTEILPRVNVRSPRLYAGEVDPVSGRFTLMLEDLSDSWVVGDAVAGGTVEQAEAALTQLARLQVPLWNDPSIRELAWLAPIERTQAYFDIVEPALPAFRERFAPRMDPAHRELAERLGAQAGRYVQWVWSEPLVVTHGDFRLDNLLFTDDAGTLEAAVLDWQSVRVAPPLVDVSIYLATCLDPDVRRTHQDDLLRGYHDALVQGGVSDFSFAECLERFRQASPWTLMLGIGTSVTLEQSERGDAMFASLLQRSAELAADTNVAELLG